MLRRMIVVVICAGAAYLVLDAIAGAIHMWAQR